MLLWWLGQSGFLLTAGGGAVAVLVDPWLSPHPERAVEPVRPEVLPDRVDLVLATHGHEDHLDLPALAGLAAAGRLGAVLVPTPHVPRTRAALPGAAVLGVQPGDRLDWPRLRVVRAWHGQEIADGYTDGLGGGVTAHVGYLLELGGVRVYHAGDTLATPELAAEVRRFAPDVALLPVNGRDERRERAGILGNMTAAEAVELAAAVGARTLVPMHYDGVRGNTADPAAAGAAAAGHPGLKVVVPDRGSRVPIRAR